MNIDIPPAIMHILVAAGISMAACSVGIPLFLALARLLGVYAIVQERRCFVYVLFGNVVATLDEPGLHFLLAKAGWRALVVNWLGRRYEVDLRLDQEYLRSLPVNSEEGAPMGIGIWYEMFVSDPVAYIFKNTDPRGSLAANVNNSVMRCLSNMPLTDMLSNRLAMSRSLREEVSPQSHDWGYKLGSVYIRKVHFRDAGMIGQIEGKVVNRLRQVTAAITQDGSNQVNIIISSANRLAAVEFAKAAAMRPQIVGSALNEISQDAEVAQAMFAVLETQKMLESKAAITMIPKNTGFMRDLLAVTDNAR